MFVCARSQQRRGGGHGLLHVTTGCAAVASRANIPYAGILRSRGSYSGEREREREKRERERERRERARARERERERETALCRHSEK